MSSITITSTSSPAAAAAAGDKQQQQQQHASRLTTPSKALPPNTTRALLHFAVPPCRLGHDPARYLDPEVGPSWPLEAHDVGLYDLRSELDGCSSSSSSSSSSSVPTKTVMEQLETRGFGALRHKSGALGSLAEQDVWNAAYLEETKDLIKTHLGATDVFIWNSVTRSSSPSTHTPYTPSTSANFQTTAIKGLQFGTATVRPTASGAHVDQDAPNSRRMCRGAAGGDCFERYRRVQQINLWRPLRGPVREKPLAVCDGGSVRAESKGIHCGLFGTRVTLHHDDSQKWYYIKHQQPDECLLLKIYDSAAELGGHAAEYAPHTGVDDLYGADDDLENPATEKEARESIEVRIVACYA
ncbi:uncharacterized protein B0I36DRAFT_67674 [Microdochium trichocladiopsis]|uniref:Uncharacterized protein n=1 Tax=Microdochium trichocladiopsis TaxID=1682393 RepID=A0A9P8YER0_9PEZI|nr:uncharacterized protein B0I36DRAFT_67674 [Microdochium trichocladiopsis]KAH7037552.1 hypothetical protein B0I36DRAFT_67674 [Microdochium trichocladiopsis]